MYQYSEDFPIFMVNGRAFALTVQEDEIGGVDVVLMMRNGGAWGSFPDPDDDNVPDGGMIAEMVTDQMIMDHGSLKNFVLWCLAEAYRRAQEKAAAFAPDPNDRIARMRNALAHLVEIKNEHPVLIAPYDQAGVALP